MSNEIEFFKYSVHSLSDEAFLLRIILSTQVISSPVDYNGKQMVGTELRIKTMIFRLVLFIPIFTGLTWLLYATNILSILRGHFTSDSVDEAIRAFRIDYLEYPIFNTLSLAIQSAAIVAMFIAFLKVVRMLNSSNKVYKEAIDRLSELEGLALPKPVAGQ